MGITSLTGLMASSVENGKKTDKRITHDINLIGLSTIVFGGLDILVALTKTCGEKFIYIIQCIPRLPTLQKKRLMLTSR